MKLHRAGRLGIFTGLTMIAASLAIYRIMGSFENPLQYITYIIYLSGILLAQFRFYKNPDSPAAFKNFFSEGFRVFILVTLLMVVFTRVFLTLHPEIIDQMAQEYRVLLDQSPDLTPAQIEGKMEAAKKNYPIALTSEAIFGYLSIGAFGSVVGALFFTARSRA